uniref:BPTI/Kunitz inhibitor domain-containing protein n=1 Tax=Myotis lucifugus TaxID=59463 RepID=G1P9X1_MYOLU
AMRKTTLLWASVCLLLSGAFRPLDAAPEREDEEDADGTGPVPPAAGLVHQFCAYRADPGPCKALLPKFFFNVFSGQCEAFMYGGCRGNQNRFESQEACRERCIAENSLTHVQPPERPDFCFLDADMGPCGLYFRNYFYNHRSGRCEEFVYGGCEGNLNNFQSEAACQHFCGDPENAPLVDVYMWQAMSQENSLTRVQPPGRPDFCFLNPDKGPCGFHFKNYFYNHRSGRCEQFVYGGCKGNRNIFKSEAACQHFC